ncbi:DNA-binding barrel domain superfamily [Sesbania bispinosa]|nr:DNA-binding barrel domain superfamily [Sesbania bispinosa]
MVPPRNKSECGQSIRFQSNLQPDLGVIHIDQTFWENWHGNYVSNAVLIKDPTGKVFNIGVSYKSKGGAFLKGIDNMVGFYRLEGPHTVEFTYKGESNFDIRVRNRNGQEIQYGSVLNDNVVVTDSDSDEEDPEEDPIEPTYWEVTLTKAAADGTDPLHIPAKFVREVGLKEKKHVWVIDESAPHFRCKVIQPKRNRKSYERYLGLGWYQFCRMKKLKEGNVISFWTHYDPKFMYVAINCS